MEVRWVSQSPFRAIRIGVLSPKKCRKWTVHPKADSSYGSMEIWKRNQFCLRCWTPIIFSGRKEESRKNDTRIRHPNPLDHLPHPSPSLTLSCFTPPTKRKTIRSDPVGAYASTNPTGRDHGEATLARAPVPHNRHPSVPGANGKPSENGWVRGAGLIVSVSFSFLDFFGVDWMCISQDQRSKGNWI